MDFTQRKMLLSKAITAALKAGHEIVNVYQSEDFEIQLKSDESPLTKADRKAHEAISTTMDELGIPMVSEEGRHVGYEQRKHWKYCWIVDPLDGTKEFIKRNNEFTVNIALVENGKPIAGVIYAPVYQQLYFSDKDLGAFRADNIVNWNEDLETLVTNSNQLPLAGDRNAMVVVASRSHMNKKTRQFIRNIPGDEGTVQLISKGSSLKLCMVAENKADIYPRFAPTMEWDTAAGHAILAASGARLVHVDSDEELTYNKENLFNPWFICKR